jgi:hypothetical protein
MELPEMVLAAVSATADDVARARLALVYGVAADRAVVAGDLVRSRELLDLGFAAAAGDAIEGSDRYCHGAAGDLALFTGATADASEHYRASAAGFRAAGHDALAAWVTAVGALPEVYAGDGSAALSSVSDAVQAADETRCPSAQAFARYALAEASVGHDEPAARQHLNEAVRLADSVGATYVAGLAHLSLATLEARTGNVAAALPHYAALLDMWRRSGNWTQQWNTLRTLVVVLAEVDRYEAAVCLLAGIDAHAQAPRWGEDHERLVAVEQLANRAIGAERFERARLEGSAASSAEVLALAHAAVEAALSSR